MTTWTCAFCTASLSHTKLRQAKSIFTPAAMSGFHRLNTEPPCTMELVDTNAVRVAGEPDIMSAAFLNQQLT